MIKTLLISNRHNIAAIEQNKKVKEFIVDHDDYQVSDIYLGVINKIFQSINAAFVSLQASKKSGFIHAHDSGPVKKKCGALKITKIFNINQKVLVQVVKESTLHKGPKLTANITLTGQYVILMPFNANICINRHISSPEHRKTLKALAILFKPLKMGLLFKECSAGINENLLIQELNLLKKQWNYIQKSVITGLSPCLLYRNSNIVYRILQNFYNPTIHQIFIDSQTNMSLLKKYLFKLGSSSLIKFGETRPYKLKSPNETSFNLLSEMMKSALSYVSLPLGGYITIEISEALTTIDVNTGSLANIRTPRETILTTNCSAATEIGYQLRKQNITGIIIVDFINMFKVKDRLQLLKHLTYILQQDRIKAKVIQLSELGLIQIIRQRHSKSIHESLYININSLFNSSSKPKTDYLSQNLYRKIRSTNLLNSKMPIQYYKNTIFFKKKLHFYCVVYYRKHIYNIPTVYQIIQKHFQLLRVAVIYCACTHINMTTTFFYVKRVNTSVFST